MPLATTPYVWMAVYVPVVNGALSDEAEVEMNSGR